MLINKPATFEYLLRRIHGAPLIVVDVETSGLSWRTNHIIGWVLTIGPGPEDSFYVPVRHAGGGNLPSLAQVPTAATNWEGGEHSAEPFIISALRNKHLIFHNGAFDMRFMHRLGWRPSGPIGDTMIFAYIVNEVRPSLSLAACCVDENVQEKKGDGLYKLISSKFGCEANKNAMSMLWLMPGDDPVVVDYAVGDGTSTWQLWHKLLERLDKPYYFNVAREYRYDRVFKLEMDLIPVLHNMSMRGVRVDEQRLDEVTGYFQTQLKAAQDIVGDINVKSPIQVRAYFEKNGVTNWPLTPTGNPSFPEEFLKTNEPGKVLLTVRKNRTILDNFLLPMATKFMNNGRVHTEFHQTRDEEYGTRTGRLSTTSPNLGAMPGKRQGAMGRLFRSIFTPDDGREHTEADYSTMEIRICAHYCKAKLWVDGFMKGLDPHTAVSNELGINRQFAKTINLSLMTGTGKKAIASKLGLSPEEGGRVVERYFDGLPELREFQRIAGRYFDSRKMIATLLDRRLQLVDDRYYTAVNRLTQGGNADVVKACMVAASKIEGAEPLLTVYDSLLFQTEKGDETAKRKMLDVMADMQGLGINLSVPMQLEYGSGPNWGEATFNTHGKVTWFEGKPYDA